ncbi:MAG: hypothetical protein ACYTDY_08630 [Planctomycetota bacterium]|jgi:hypothetical protein
MPSEIRLSSSRLSQKAARNQIRRINAIWAAARIGLAIVIVACGGGVSAVLNDELFTIGAYLAAPLGCLCAGALAALSSRRSRTTAPGLATMVVAGATATVLAIVVPLIPYFLMVFLSEDWLSGMFIETFVPALMRPSIALPLLGSGAVAGGLWFALLGFQRGASDQSRATPEGTPMGHAS